MIYLAVELVSIPSYILAGISKNNKSSNEASLKYVIFGSFASALMLFGLSWLYGVAGSTNIYDVHAALIASENQLLIFMSLLFILVGFGYKISMVPFHYWTPDVYEGAATPVTAFFSVAPKAAGLSILIRFFYTVFTNDSGFNSTSELLNVNWTLIIAALSALTMTIGNLLALYQQNVKRMLAYSSISHIGFILIGFCVLSYEALTSIMFYIFIYIRASNTKYN
jgi:NADH-quinone oxidoreductase subunit N